VKILIAALHNGYYRNIESMVDELAARGHQLYLGAERHESALGGASIVQRLATARNEIDAVDEYDFVVVNDGLERCVAEIDAIITAARATLKRRRPAIAPILQTFKE